MPKLSFPALTLLGTVLAAPALQAQEAFSPTEEDRVRQIVREYLIENPEVIVEAIDVLRSRQQAEAEAEAKAAVEQRKADLYNNPADPVGGNPQGDVTIVEFFDYRCGYCKAVSGTLMDVISQDGNIRLVFKEFPILGPESVIAARAGLAAQRLDPARYAGLHMTMMDHRGPFSEEAILKMAESAGYDAAKLKAEMAAPEVQAHIEQTLALGRDLAISGTPAFIIGETIIPGAVDAETLKQVIAQTRKKQKG